MRLYGVGEPTVTVIRRERRRPRPLLGVSGEDIRRQLERRLEARERAIFEPEAA